MIKPIDYNSRYINTRNINMINIGTQWEIPLIDPQIRVASTKLSASIAQRRAFSLIELLVVVSVIGLLVSLALPAVQRVRESSRQVVCRNNLKQFGSTWILKCGTYVGFRSSAPSRKVVA